jgi:hypothetical protein
MQNWYSHYEPTEQRVASFDGFAGSMTTVEDAGAQHYIQYGLK